MLRKERFFTPVVQMNTASFILYAVKELAPTAPAKSFLRHPFCDVISMKKFYFILNEFFV